MLHLLGDLVVLLVLVELIIPTVVKVVALIAPLECINLLWVEVVVSAVLQVSTITEPNKVVALHVHRAATVLK